MQRFPNRAGDCPDTDERLERELRAAGIPLITDDVPSTSLDTFRKFLRSSSGEVKTSVIGLLHGWQFKRASCYWMASGPGLELAVAEALYAAHGRTVRVGGHGDSPEPGEWLEGLAIGCYHVDDAIGLQALADAIKSVVARYHSRKQAAASAAQPS